MLQRLLGIPRPDPILYDSHMHTILCRHAMGTTEDYAERGIKRNLKGIIFTCHSPMPDGWSHQIRMLPEEYDDYVAMVYRARDAYADKIDVRVGLESDWFPGMEPWLEELHQRVPLNHVLGSVHPHVPEYRERFFNGDLDEFIKIYFDHLVEAAQTGLYDTLSHPDLIKCIIPKAWKLEAILDHVRHRLDEIAETGIAMELNTSGYYKPPHEMNPAPAILEEIAKREIPIVLGSDAHNPRRVADRFPQALKLLTQCGFHSVSYFLDRKRIDVPIDIAAASLA